MPFSLAKRGNNPGQLALKAGDVGYFVYGDTTNTAAEARNYLLANAPAVVGDLYIADAQVVMLKRGLWEGRVSYTEPSRKEPVADQTKIRLRFTQGKQKIYSIGKALTRIGVYASTGTVTDPFNGAIGVDEKNVAQGAEVPTSLFAFSVTKYFPVAAVTQSLLQSFYSINGKVNSDNFSVTDDDGISLAFGAKECMFHGVINGDAVERTNGTLIPLTFEFTGGMIVSNVGIGGGITIPEIAPHDLVWTQYERDSKTVGSSTIWTLTPKYAVVDRPKTATFASLGLLTSAKGLLRSSRISKDTMTKLAELEKEFAARRAQLLKGAA